MENLQKDHTYLIRYGNTTTLSLITVLTITDTSYQIRWNNNVNNSITWELKEKLYRDYSMIEDITDVDYDKSIQYDINYISPPPQLFPEYRFPTYKYKSCPTCNGTGYVPDYSTSAGTKLCPQCVGGKIVLDTIET